MHEFSECELWEMSEYERKRRQVLGVVHVGCRIMHVRTSKHRLSGTVFYINCGVVSKAKPPQYMYTTKSSWQTSLEHCGLP